MLLYHEMVAAGYTAVGEFHYPHHRPGGTPYDDPNAMAKATVAAARDAGIEIVLLMCAYARAGAGKPPTEGQARFCDPDVTAYLARVEALAGECRVGLAPHSVRAVPREWLEQITRYAESSGMVVHIHANEQRREIEECESEYGMRPIELLAEVGRSDRARPSSTPPTFLERELDLLAETGSCVCACPTTEANLGDGFLPAAELLERGVPVCIGSDSNTIIDPSRSCARSSTAPVGWPNGATCWSRRAMTVPPRTCSRSAAETAPARSVWTRHRVSWRSISRT